MIATIPPIFHAFDSESPFEKCSVCGKNLLAHDQRYMVEKGFRDQQDGSDPAIVFEIAICMECAMDMHNDLSDSSKASMQSFLSNEVRLQDHLGKMLTAHNGEYNNEWLANCVATGKSKTTMNEYQVFGTFIGQHMWLGGGPYLLGSEVLEDLQSLLSVKTKDEMDGFIEDMTGPDPALKALLHEKVVIF